MPCTQSIGIAILHCITWTHQAVWPENEASVVPKVLVSARKMVGTLGGMNEQLSMREGPSWGRWQSKAKRQCPGLIHCYPPDKQLYYIVSKTKILAIDCNIKFIAFISKLSALGNGADTMPTSPSRTSSLARTSMPDFHYQVGSIFFFAAKVGSNLCVLMCL